MKVTEGNIKGFTKKYELPVVKNLCPADHTTRREEMKHLLSELKKKYPGVTNRLLHAAEFGAIEDWEKMKARIK